MFAKYFAQLLIDRKITVSDLAKFLSKHNMTPLMFNVLKYLEHKEAQHLVHNTIVIETPFDLSEKSISTIKRKVGNDLAETEIVENKNLLAGYVARFKGLEYDASAKTILENFTRS